MHLIVGPVAVGKTTLMKRLQSYGQGNREFAEQDLPTTIPTAGTNLVNIILAKKCELTIRELGGQMAPIWHNYYKNCKCFMFMVDISNKMQISAVAIELMEALRSKDLKTANVLIIFNKSDAACFTLTEIVSVIMLDDIKKHAPQNIEYTLISAKTGDGIIKVIQWLRESVEKAES